MQRSFVTLALLVVAGCGESSKKLASPSDPIVLDAGGPDAHAGDDDEAPNADGPIDRARDAGAQAADRDADTTARALRLPPLNAAFDYQLGGSYAPDAKVQVVSRDRKEAPAPGLYNICYVNGFQTQPDEGSFWQGASRRDLILRDAKGRPVEDTEWHEQLLDIRGADRRTRLAEIVGEWITGCADAGFDAVEIDNLDSYSRSSDPDSKRPLLSEADAVAFMRLLADRAHALGLAIAQKNSAELVGQKAELGTDFAVAEECNQYTECDVYRSAYGDHVLIIEYQRSAFQKGCAAYPQLPIVLRDVDLRRKGVSGYVFDAC